MDDRKKMTIKEKILGGLWGAVIGNALGVPVEFTNRQELKKHPVTTMKGYGTFNLPAGSWSDDSSLMLCTVESLIHGFDIDLTAKLFVRWYNEGFLTPWGVAFDIGRTTQLAIKRIIKGIPPHMAGGINEHDNGNGSLMRILPVGIYFALKPASEILNAAHMMSSITHRHIRSQIACGFYCLMVSYLLRGFEPEQAYHYAIEQSYIQYSEPPYLIELTHFERILKGNMQNLPEDEIQSGGYVVNTLEAGIWCLLNSHTFTEAVLKAVNLGYDTDTTGIVTGGLAGVVYGIDAIPNEWIKEIARKEDIERLFGDFVDTITKNNACDKQSND